ncbi:MAG: phosphodiester glycosidase family protein [Bacteroidetes bacterium]|nr:phosphodiester glycosidase family protein [Bacteroidota bacterium]
MNKFLLHFTFLFFVGIHSVKAQANWKNIDIAYAPLPQSFHIYKSTDSIDGKPNIMYYVTAPLADKHLIFSVDTSKNRRLTPEEFYKKSNQPLLVVNGSFFSFKENSNLNAVVKNGKLVSFNEFNLPGKKSDTLTWYHPFFGAFGISKNRKADVAWVYADSNDTYLKASQWPLHAIHDSIFQPREKQVLQQTSLVLGHSGKLVPQLKKWKMNTVIGGGPVLIQNGEVKISNNEEMKFAGKAISDRHPRTAIGYTKEGQIIILVSEGRSESAAGLTLPQMADILQKLGCTEALNLDGGGSTCMIINGKQVNYPSDKGEQRMVPSVFIISQK